MDLSQLQNWMIENNYPKYRAGQLYGWLWKREVDDFQQMRNLPLEMREGNDSVWSGWKPSITARVRTAV